MIMRLHRNISLVQLQTKAQEGENRGNMEMRMEVTANEVWVAL